MYALPCVFLQAKARSCLLAVTIDRAARTAKFDFTGTGSEIFGNTNAPRAVLLTTTSSIVDASTTSEQNSSSTL